MNIPLIWRHFWRLALATITSAAILVGLPIVNPFPAYAEVSSEMGSVAAEVTGDLVTLTWTDPNFEGEIEITRGGESLVSDRDSGKFQDLNYGSEDYVVTWRRELTNGELQEVIRESVQGEKFQADPDQLVHIDSTVLQIGDSVFQPESAVALTLPSSTTFRYTTFIRDEFVYAPDIACVQPSGSVYEYNGNNRGFSATSSSFKTRFGVTADWTNGGDLSVTRSVQPTKLYKLEANGTRTLLQTKTASTAGMSISVVSESPTLSSFRLTHDVKNPFCNSLAGGIFYDVRVSVARSEPFSASGTVLKFPDHELYVKDNNQSAWTVIFQNRASNIFCLVAGSSQNSDCLDVRKKSGVR